MTARIDSEWKRKQEEVMDDFKNGIHNSAFPLHYKVTTPHAIIKKWVVLTLIKKRIPYRVLNMGAGVSTITTETDICPKCKGLGRI